MDYLSFATKHAKTSDADLLSLFTASRKETAMLFHLNLERAIDSFADHNSSSVMFNLYKSVVGKRRNKYQTVLDTFIQKYTSIRIFSTEENGTIVLKHEINKYKSGYDKDQSIIAARAELDKYSGMDLCILALVSPKIDRAGDLAGGKKTKDKENKHTEAGETTKPEPVANISTAAVNADGRMDELTLVLEEFCNVARQAYDRTLTFDDNGEQKQSKTINKLKSVIVDLKKYANATADAHAKGE